MKKFLSILYFILAFLFLLLSIIMIPNITKLANYIILYVIALIIIIYIIHYLIKLVKKYTGIKQIIVVIEMVLDFVIILALCFSEFVNFITINESLKIIGIIIWIHSFFSLLRGFYILKENKEKYSISKYILYLIIITLTTILIASSIFNVIIITYVMCCISLVISILSLLFGIYNLKKKKML